MSTEEIEQNYARYGCHHVACGRVLRGHRTAALEDDAMDRPAPTIEPVRHVIEGARSFASKHGLADPHKGIDYHAVRSNRGLLTDLAHEYDKLPAHDPSAEKHFDAMRDEVNHQYHHLTNTMGVKVHVMDHDPYRNVHELADDVRNNHQIKVLGTEHTGGHPYFSNAENDRFRAVHDVFGHLGTGRDFDRHGEEAAFQAHARMFSHHARPAMTSETRGQNGSLIVNGSFGPQKIAVMPKRLWHPGLANEAALSRTAETARVRDGVPNSIMEPGREYPVVKHDQSNLGHSKYVVLDTGKGRGNYIWAHEEHVHLSTLADDYRLHRVDQERRAENAGHGYGEETRAFYGDPGVARGDQAEKSLTFKDYLHHMRQPREEEEPLPDREWHAGHEMGSRHAGDPEHADFGELHHSHDSSPHPDQFFAGYRHGWESTVPQRVATLLGYGGEPAAGSTFKRLGHVSGNSVDVLHCPFCGSGAVIARSDGTIECNFCTSVFTVQVQPQYAAFPQTVQGQPYEWPGMPSPDSVVAPGAPGGPLPPGADEGMDEGDGGDAPPWMEDGDDADGADDGVGGPPDEDEDEEGDPDDDAPGATVKGRSQPPWLKKSYRNAQGHPLDGEDLLRHLAILHAHNRSAMAARVKAGR